MNNSFLEKIIELDSQDSLANHEILNQNFQFPDVKLNFPFHSFQNKEICSEMMDLSKALNGDYLIYLEFNTDDLLGTNSDIVKKVSQNLVDDCLTLSINV